MKSLPGGPTAALVTYVCMYNISDYKEWGDGD